MRSLFQLLGALGLTGIVLVGWLAVRLADGPVSLSFMLPYLESALSRSDGTLTIHIHDTVLAWSQADHLLEIKALNSTAYGADGQAIVTVPELSVTLSGVGLLHGQVVPRGLSFLHPALRLQRDADGARLFDAARGAGAGTADSGIPLSEGLAALLLPGAGLADGGSALRRVDVVGGSLTVDDRILGKVWRIPTFDLTIRPRSSGIAVGSHLEIALEGQPAALDLTANYRPDQKSLTATLVSKGLVPAPLAALSPLLDPLLPLQLPLSGMVTVTYQVGHGLADARFDVSGGAGLLDASGAFGFKTPVESLMARGSFDAKAGRLVLESLRIDRGEGVVALSGSIDGLDGDARIDLLGRLNDLPLSALPGLWPRGVAANPREWILANIPRGVMRSADVHLSGHLPAGQAFDALVVDTVDGHMQGEGLSLQYLSPMPLVTGIDVEATFDLDTFRFQTHGGVLGSLQVPEGSVLLSGLSKEDQFADLDVRIDGSLAEALLLIDGKPLNWTRKLGIAGRTVSGDVSTRLRLHFPLIANLNTNDIEAHADILGTAIGLSKVLADQDLDQGTLTLTVDNSGLDLAGTARLGGVPTALKWRENFLEQAPFKSRYQLSALLSDNQRRLFVASSLFQPPYLSGDVRTDVVATSVVGGRTELAVTADLTPAVLRFPGFNLEKASGGGGGATATVVLDAAHNIVSVPQFSIVTPTGVDVAGTAIFADGHPQRITVQHARWARTNLAAVIDIPSDEAPMSVDVVGASLDAREFMSGVPSDRPANAARPPRRPDDPVTPMKVRARLVSAWLSDHGSVSDVTAEIEQDRRVWRQARLAAKLDGGKAVLMTIVPGGADTTTLSLSSDDAGAVLRSLGFHGDMNGGVLSVIGSYADNKPHRPLVGVASVKDFQEVHAPGLLRLLTVAALTGIADELQGQGISFSTLTAPFTYTDDGLLTLRDSRAFGAALGLTVRGDVDFDKRMMNLDGTIVPMYALNSAFNNVPLIGGLFSAEKGGGLLAIGFSMKGPIDNPDVTPFPFTALTPGFLRQFFDLFDGRPDIGAHSAP